MKRAALIALLALGLLPATAGAHAQLEATTPQRGAVLKQQPAQVEFDFDETVEGNFGAVRIFDRAGKRVDQGDSFHPGGVGKRLAAHLKPGLRDGTYTATYRVISADGHVVSGGLVFSVGRAGAAGQTVDQLLDKSRAGPVTGTAFAATRAIGYLALALAAGSLLMVIWLWPAQGEAAGEAMLLRSRRMLLLAALLGTISAVAAVVLEAAQGAGVGAFAALKPGTLEEVIGTRFGTVWTIAAGCWLAVLLIVAVLPRAKAATAMTALPLAFLLCAPGLSGHAASSNTLLLFPANVLHVTAMACWLGGLVALLYVIPRGRRPDAVIARFSDVALVAVVVLLITGLLQAVIEIRHFDLVLSTPYGRAVLIKLVFLIALIDLGALNRFKGPRRTTLKIEVALIVVVLGVTGALAGYAPARSAKSGPFNASTRIGPQRLDITVDPAVVGANTVHIYLTDPKTGAQIDNAKEVDVAALMPAKSIGPLREKALKSGPGHYTVAGLVLGVGGHWDITVTVRVSDFDQYEQKVGLQIR